MNKLTYSKCGDYYIPDLTYDVPDTPIGKYGLLREQYLKEYHSARYNHLFLSGQLYPHLIDINEQAQQMLDSMIPQMAKQENVTEELKSIDQMEWVGKMNNIKARVEEIIFNEIIYI